MGVLARQAHDDLWVLRPRSPGQFADPGSNPVLSLHHHHPPLHLGVDCSRPVLVSLLECPVGRLQLLLGQVERPEAIVLLSAVLRSLAEPLLGHLATEALVHDAFVVVVVVVSDFTFFPSFCLSRRSLLGIETGELSKTIFPLFFFHPPPRPPPAFLCRPERTGASVAARFLLYVSTTY